MREHDRRAGPTLTQEPPAHEPVPSVETAAAAPRLSRGLAGVLALLTVAALALATLIVVYGMQVRDNATMQDRRNAALQTARQQVLNLTTLDYRHIDKQLKALLDGSTGDFRRQFQGTMGTFTEVVRQGKVEATGTVVGAGVARFDDDTARVLVATTTSVKNSGSKQAQPRQYRLAVELKREGDQWLVSGMEFVP